MRYLIVAEAYRDLEQLSSRLALTAPIPASSGKTRRHRLSRGGNREANHALWRIVITRMSAHPATPRPRPAAHR